MDFDCVHNLSASFDNDKFASMSYLCILIYLFFPPLINGLDANLCFSTHLLTEPWPVSTQGLRSTVKCADFLSQLQLPLFCRYKCTPQNHYCRCRTCFAPHLFTKPWPTPPALWSMQLFTRQTNIPSLHIVTCNYQHLYTAILLVVWWSPKLILLQNKKYLWEKK